MDLNAGVLGCEDDTDANSRLAGVFMGLGLIRELYPNPNASTTLLLVTLYIDSLKKKASYYPEEITVNG